MPKVPRTAPRRPVTSGDLASKTQRAGGYRPFSVSFSSGAAALQPWTSSLTQTPCYSTGGRNQSGERMGQRVLVIAALLVAAPVSAQVTEIYKCFDAMGRSFYSSDKNDMVGKKCELVSREVNVSPVQRPPKTTTPFIDPDSISQTAKGFIDPDEVHPSISKPQTTPPTPKGDMTGQQARDIGQGVQKPKESPPAQSPATAGIMLWLAIAYLTRRRAIGGWLLFYYAHLYGGLLLGVILFALTYKNLSPSEWDSAIRYVMSLLSYVPSHIIFLLEAFAATRLLARRTSSNLGFLRWTLIAAVITQAVSAGIDSVYFFEDPMYVLSILSFIMSVIWCAYFWRSERVNAVFVERNWNYEAFAPKPPIDTPAQRRHRIIRTVIVGSVTFIAFLIIMAAAVETKPDASLFLLPAFYGLVAAAVAWALRVKRKPEPAISPWKA